MAKRFKTLSDYLTSTGTSLEVFADRVGLSVSYVSMLANGQRTPSLPLALRIASEANIPVASLVPSESESITPQPTEQEAL
jgi:transcriptional regulator with XRE-family HTH domain